MPLEPTIFVSMSGLTADGELYLSTMYADLVYPHAWMPGTVWPFTTPPSAVAFRDALPGYAVTWAYLASLMRFIDSNTLVTSDALGSRVLSCPVLTKPLLSCELDILVGCAAAMTMLGGAIELPPDWELSEPIRLSKPPRAPNW